MKACGRYPAEGYTVASNFPSDPAHKVGALLHHRACPISRRTENSIIMFQLGKDLTMQQYRKWRPIFVFSLLASLLGTSPAIAHNLWVVGNPDGKDEGMVHMYFEHHVGPGDGTYNEPITARGETWLRRGDGTSETLNMEEISQGGDKYFAGRIPGVSGSYAIDHTSLFGIYKGQLDFFHGAYLAVEDPGDLAGLADSLDLAVRIVPEWNEDGVLLRLMYFETPKPRADLVVFHGDGKEEKFKTNNKGEVALKVDAPGRYHVAAWVFEHDAAGAFENKAYKGLMHGTTLTLDIERLPEADR
jgi:hypothetical protein